MIFPHEVHQHSFAEIAAAYQRALERAELWRRAACLYQMHQLGNASAQEAHLAHLEALKADHAPDA